MDPNLAWKQEEALIVAREGIQLTPGQEMRMSLAALPAHPSRDARKAVASLLMALARRLDPESASFSAAATTPNVAGT